ncbi:hypothetical protein ACHAW5_010637 [Stephanodiscus triporus]|uniref:DNA replication complex GINS protein PSF2 N-terminal domain-containing protein n=1 Tax=Stephanodiscus triporus TaxID=2934178 RepID=A0ABD3QKS2_9STRA
MAAATAIGGSGSVGAPSSVGSGGAPPSVSFFGNADLSTSRALAASTFLAGDEPVAVIPSFSLPEPLELTSGTVGPFRAGMDAVVPLWLATTLRRRKLAKIVPPSWMDVDVLREVLRFERDRREASFSPDLPFRHAEVARAILSACRAGSGTGSSAGDGGDGQEVPNADQVKLLLEDIAAVRMDKIRRNVHQLSASTLTTRGGTEIVIDVTNIGSLEMHAIRPFVLESFRLHRELSGKGSSYSRDVEPDSDNNNSSSGGGGGGGRTGVGGTAGIAANRGRLQHQRQSRLARESENAVEEEEEDEEKLMEPRPLEEIEREEEEAMAETDPDAGRSRLRRHR